MKNSPFTGHFITLEGGEGAGKSTLIGELADRLTLSGYSVLVTREPGGTVLGETVRQWLLENSSRMSIGNRAELLLFLAARAQHIQEKILPALKAGKIVLCDRFNDSTIAYQGVARGLGIDYVTRLCELVTGPVCPELTLLLDVDPETGRARSQGLHKEQAPSGELDRIEGESPEFHCKIRKAFEKLAKREPLRIYKIDAGLSREAVRQEAIRAIEQLVLLPSKKARSFLL